VCGGTPQGVFHGLQSLRQLVIDGEGVVPAVTGSDKPYFAHRGGVGQVPVELVELVHGEDVDILLDLVHRPEMTAGIEHAPAVGAGMTRRLTAAITRRSRSVRS